MVLVRCPAFKINARNTLLRSKFLSSCSAVLFASSFCFFLARFRPFRLRFAAPKRACLCSGFVFSRCAAFSLIRVRGCARYMGIVFLHGSPHELASSKIVTRSRTRAGWLLSESPVSLRALNESQHRTGRILSQWQTFQSNPCTRADRHVVPLKVTRIPSFLVNKTSVQHLRHHNADKRRTIITRAANNFQETGDGRSLKFRRVRRQFLRAASAVDRALLGQLRR